ncbi:MAG TPA: hypothetical protein VGP46_07470, partial [Acidimicrobiales bacterium]|nr:hypothetical protein [Acidimicrobiales bacterium]
MTELVPKDLTDPITPTGVAGSHASDGEQAQQTAMAPSDVLLADGSTAHFRYSQPDDTQALIKLHERLSRQSSTL